MGGSASTSGLPGFLGSFCNISVAKFASSSYLGLLRGLIMCTNAGVLIKQMGSLDAVASSSEGKRELIINIVVWLVFFVGLFVFFRYLIVRVLPRLISEGIVIDVPASSSGSTGSSSAEQSKAAHAE